MSTLDIPSEPFQDWIREARSRHQNNQIKALLEEARTYLQSGNNVQAADAARSLLAIDSYYEPAFCLLMMAEAAEGRRNIALRLYSEFTERLKDDLGAMPEEQTSTLAEQIRRGEQINTSPLPSQNADTRPTLAVLPFADLGGTEGFFADGVVEEITGSLSRVREFFVVARQSAFALKNEALDIPTAAAKLGADYLVEGTVRRSGDRVRITAQLVEGRTGQTLWSERFDDQLDDLFDLQDRIAEQVAGAVSPNLRTAEIAKARTNPPENRTAYELVLTALPHFWAHRREENTRAIELLSSALRLNTDFAPALAFKAWSLAQQPSYLWSENPEKDRAAAIKLAEEAALKARDHAPSLVAIGAVYSLCTTNLALSNSFIERALAIDPSNAWAWMRQGWNSCYGGDFDKSIEQFEMAKRLSPLDPFLFNIRLGIGNCQFMKGNKSLGISMVEEAIAIAPGMTWAYRMLAFYYAQTKQEAKAKNAVAVLLTTTPDLTIKKWVASAPPLTYLMRNSDFMVGLIEAGIPEK